jgi:hypothetical protein
MLAKGNGMVSNNISVKTQLPEMGKVSVEK